MNKKILIPIVFIIGLLMISRPSSMPEDAFPSPKKNERTGKWGFVYNKKTVIDFMYDDADEFLSDLARVEIDGKWGYIDKTGMEVIPPKFDSANNFDNEWAKVGLNGKYGFIDKTGKEVIPLMYETIGDFSRGLAKVSLKEKWGYINTAGQEIIPIKYDHIGSFKNGLAVVHSNGKYGYVDREGRVIIPVKYDEAKDFTNGSADVRLAENTGKVDTTGIFTVLSTKISLVEAIKKKYVRFTAHGSSIESSYINVENVTNMKLHLVIPAGTFLNANPGNYQNMVLTSPKDIVLVAGEKYSEYVSTACMNMYRDIPSDNTSFGIAQRAENHLLSKVIRLLNEGNYRYSVIQAAVWIVTDGADYNDMGILHNQYMQRTIDLEDYKKAVSIVNEARKMK